jgi:hypothetical protein
MASYLKPNVQTFSEILAASPDAAKLAWGELAIRKSNDYSVLYDNLTGKIGSGKAFIQHNDLRVTAGNEVVIPLVGGARGPGVQGAGDRLGKEKKLVPKDFRFKVGRWWDGFAINSVAKNETIIGGKWDRAAMEFLARNLRIKKVDDMLLELIKRSTSRNVVRPNNKTSRGALRTSDVFSTATVLHGVNSLVSLAAKPVNVGRSDAGAPIHQFVFLGNQHALESFRNSSTYLEAAYHADVRGKMNSLFTGNILPWNGNLIYNWDVQDPEDLAPAGCPLVPRAFLGNAIAAGTALADITGGGSPANAADTEVKFFQYFSNAQYVGCEGQKVAADAASDRYVAILNLSGAQAGKVMFASYKVNNGNKLTMFKRLGASATGDQVTTLGQITWGSGSYGGVQLTNEAATGSLIVEVNEFGVPFGYVLGLGEMAGVMGHGSIDGASAIAKRTEEHTNHDMDHAIGMETVFGSRAFERIDGQPGGYVLVECALPLRGFPTVV